MILISKSIFINIDNIDTDIIIPKQFLITLKKTGFSKCLFYDLRYIINNNKIFLNKDFVLNNFILKNSKIIISKKNFGCGSSREHAVWAFNNYGIKIIIANSFSNIFFDNSMKNSLFLIKLNIKKLNILLINIKNVFIINIKYQYIKFNNNLIYFHANKFYKNIFIKKKNIIDFILEKKEQIKKKI